MVHTVGSVTQRERSRSSNPFDALKGKNIPGLPEVCFLALIYQRSGVFTSELSSNSKPCQEEAQNTKGDKEKKEKSEKDKVIKKGKELEMEVYLVGTD